MALGQEGPSLNTQQLLRVLLLAALGHIRFESLKKYLQRQGMSQHKVICSLLKACRGPVLPDRNHGRAVLILVTPEP
jgi:hypothetical protein